MEEEGRDQTLEEEYGGDGEAHDEEQRNGHESQSK
jgi:hypothetical protein